MKKECIIQLTTSERQGQEALIRKGKAAAYRRTHAQILLWANEGEQGKGLRMARSSEPVGRA